MFYRIENVQNFKRNDFIALQNPDFVPSGFLHSPNATRWCRRDRSDHVCALRTQSIGSSFPYRIYGNRRRRKMKFHRLFNDFRALRVIRRYTERFASCIFLPWKLWMPNGLNHVLFFIRLQFVSVHTIFQRRRRRQCGAQHRVMQSS